MKNSFIRFLTLAAILAIAVIVASCGGGGDKDTKPTGDVIIPIEFQNAESVGSINIRLSYDSTMLQLNNVVAGDLAENAMLEYNAPTPGLVAIGIIDSNGINGTGSVARIGFNAISTTGTCPLRFELIETHNAVTLVEIYNQPSDGSYNTTNRAINAPKVNFTD